MPQKGQLGSKNNEPVTDSGLHSGLPDPSTIIVPSLAVTTENAATPRLAATVVVADVANPEDTSKRSLPGTYAIDG